MKTQVLKLTISVMLGFACSIPMFSGKRQMEYLDRGVVAVKVNKGVFLSWRFLGTDLKEVGFNVYRDGTRLNSSPITTKTNFVDVNGQSSSNYVVKTVLNGNEIESSNSVTPWSSQQKTLTLRRPGANYTPNDMSVGDVDGDGQYELFVKWDGTSKDNSQDGVTDNVYIDCYRLDGTFLWRIDLGVNIRAGAHYTQFQVYDYDGDGKCEMVCKTAPGTKDGNGKYVIMNNDDPTKDYRNSSGYILSGPEYLTIFDGASGAEINTIAYVPDRGTVSSWGDKYGNRVDRFLACTAYLDGEHPSIVMCRGYYTRATLAAFDYKNGKLVQRWYHNSATAGQGAYGEGDHSILVADVDNDGKDELIYGSACIDDDGSLYYRTGFGHGDAMHVSDLNPDRDGLEGWFVHEEKTSAYGFEMRDLKTGKVIFGESTGTDVGRGLAADIDANHRGFEMWSTANNNVYDCRGNVISTKRPSVNFRIYWDGDLQDELLDGNKCDKWNGNGTDRLITFAGNSCNSTKATPCLSADIFGDWREEVILQDGDKIYIYTTTLESDYRLFTLMHDPVYRCAVAWQNTAYNQPPHLGFYIGDGIEHVSQPDIYVAGHEEPTVATLSFEGSLNQELLPDEQLSAVSFTFGGTATSVDISGLPNGVTAKVAGNTVLISGSTPDNAVVTVKTVGGINEVSYQLKITQANGDLKRVAYIADTTNVNFAGDKIYTMLRNMDDLYVRLINSDRGNADLSLFDMVLISETTPSNAPIIANLKGIDKPVLNMKVHAYKNATATWNWAANGYGDNLEQTNIVVSENAKSHPIFKDVNYINGNEIQMVTSVNTKAITYMIPSSFTEANGTIANIANVKDATEQVCILQMEAGTSIAGTTLSERFIQIGLNSSSYLNLTEDALSIVKNACYYLLGMIKPASTEEPLACVCPEWKIFQNTAKNSTKLFLSTPSEGDALVEIFDLSGGMLDTFSMQINSGVSEIPLNLSKQIKGCFILKVTVNDLVWQTKIVLH